MSFVFSVWYFIALAVVVGIVACLIVCYKMDKKDRVLIEEFVKKAEKANSEKTEESAKDEKSE